MNIDLTGINTDFAIAVAVIAVSALVLHYKSHVKFVALGVFVGMVLLQITPMEEYFASPAAEGIASVAFLAVPALLLGVNHVVDKRKKGNKVWKTIFVLVFTLFFLSSIAQVLPMEAQEAIMNRSIIGWQILDNFNWFTYAAAVLVVIDSMQHKREALKAKKRKKKTKTAE